MKLWEVTVVEKSRTKMKVRASNYFEAIDKAKSGYCFSSEKDVLDEDWEAEEVEREYD
jgi:hypothetical protein